MPSYTRDKKRDQLTYVPMNSILYYGFNTKDLSALAGVSAADLSALLGHVPGETAAATANIILVLGANSPKPPRVTRKLENASPGTQQSVSTFCAPGKLATAIAAKWNVSKKGTSVSLRPPRPASGSQTAIAELSDGTLYAFSMNKEDFAAYGSILGLKQASSIRSATERGKLVAGSTRPKPGRAKLVLDSGATISSFYSTEAADELADGGWDIIDDEIVLAATVGGTP